MRVKKLGIAFIAAGMLSANAYANDAAIERIEVQPQAAFTEADMSALFEQDGQPMQLAALSPEEMRETEGAWVWWAAGAAAGSIMNTVTYIGSNPNWTYGGAAWAALSGAAGGLYAGLPGSNLARFGYGALGAYAAGQPWGGYSWSRW